MFDNRDKNMSDNYKQIKTERVEKTAVNSQSFQKINCIDAKLDSNTIARQNMVISLLLTVV